MKRDFDMPDLRAAFSEEPAACRNALLSAARSVKEEEPVKKATFRAVLVAALIIVATMAIAVAAGNLLGWNDFYKDYGPEGKVLPGAAQTVMANAGEKTYTLGNMQFTVGGLYCDGRVAMANTTIRTADGSEALICSEPYDAIAANGENGAALAERLGLEERATWIDAAKQLNLPLYTVRACLELQADMSTGEGMEDVLYNEDGSLAYYAMAFMNGRNLGKSVPMEVFLRVAQIDPATGEETGKLTTREPITMNREEPSAIHRFTVESKEFNGFKVDGVSGELLPAGLYLYTSVYVAEGTVEDVYNREYPEWLQSDGTAYPTGLNLSVRVDADNFPVIGYEHLIPVEDIPEEMILSLWGEEIKVDK